MVVPVKGCVQLQVETQRSTIVVANPWLIVLERSACMLLSVVLAIVVECRSPAGNIKDICNHVVDAERSEVSATKNGM